VPLKDKPFNFKFAILISLTLLLAPLPAEQTDPQKPLLKAPALEQKGEEVNASNLTLQIKYYFADKVNSPQSIRTNIKTQKASIDKKLESFKTKMKNFLKDRKALEIEKSGESDISVYTDIKSTPITTTGFLTVIPQKPQDGVVYLSSPLPLDVNETIVQDTNSQTPEITYYLVFIQPVVLKFPANEIKNINKGLGWLLPAAQNENSILEDLKVRGTPDTLLEIIYSKSATMFNKQIMLHYDSNSLRVKSKEIKMINVKVNVFGIRKTALVYE